MRIRELNDSDLPAILAIQAKCPEAAQWQARDYTQLAAERGGMVLVGLVELTVAPTERGQASREQDRAEQTGRKQTRKASEDHLAGFCAFYWVCDEAELRNLAVDPEHRRLRIALNLLQEAHRTLREAGVVRVHAEVRSSNLAAQELYVALGYRKQSTRRDYYHAPLEDAETLLLDFNR
jgi:tRNA threonylcarbamoyladenosine biosynthesis protein TsaB